MSCYNILCRQCWEQPHRASNVVLTWNIRLDIYKSYMRATSLWANLHLEQSSNCLQGTSPLLIMLFSIGGRRALCPARVIVLTQRPPFQSATCRPFHSIFTSKSLFFRRFRGIKSEGKTSSSGPLLPTQEGLNHMIRSSTCRQTSLCTNLHRSSFSKGSP